MRCRYMHQAFGEVLALNYQMAFYALRMLIVIQLIVLTDIVVILPVLVIVSDVMLQVQKEPAQM